VINLSVPTAYIGVILIWATTPLAIKWSSEGPGFLFGVVSRMFIGTLCLVLLHVVLRKSLIWHRKAVLSYGISACSIYGAMMSVYWGAQYIPSGWISVIFGLSPLLTAGLSALWLHERSLTGTKLIGMFVGVGGLFVLFGSAVDLGQNAALGVGSVVLSVLIFSASAVGLKRIGSHLPALSVTTGGLLFALPVYLLTLLLISGGIWPHQLPLRSAMSIAYLGIVATSFGFVMYFYVLKHLAATRVALITLITPVLALLIGMMINNEQIDGRAWLGTGLILLGLLLHEFKVPQRWPFRRGQAGVKLPDAGW